MMASEGLQEDSLAALCRGAQGGGGRAEVAAKHGGHVGDRAEPRPRGDGLERQVGRGHEAAGLGEPHLEDVVADRAADELAKPLLDLPAQWIVRPPLFMMLPITS